MMNILAGIVLFNPDLNRLRENITAIGTQIKKTVLVENGSENTEYLNMLNNFNIVLIKNDKNYGIAKALNQILQYAFDKGYDWVFTLDQDSVSDMDVIEKLCQDIRSDAGIVCANAIDRNFKSVSTRVKTGIEEVEACITSGSLTNVKAWRGCGGFDEKMFIDWVDWDICYAMRSQGYKIYLSNNTHILHELGTNTKSIHIGKHEYLILNRSPFRYYYVIRNRIYLARKYSFVSLSKEIYYNIRDILIAMAFESHKMANFRSMCNGFKDGFKMKING